MLLVCCRLTTVLAVALLGCTVLLLLLPIPLPILLLLKLISCTFFDTITGVHHSSNFSLCVDITGTARSLELTEAYSAACST
jgi:hypothetical protein